jgi:hypothetical protein
MIDTSINKNFGEWVEYIEEGIVCQENPITRYGSVLLINSSASPVRRRTLMITIQIMHAWPKSWVVDFRKLSFFFLKPAGPDANLTLPPTTT